MSCMTGGGTGDHSPEEWKALKARVAELELQLEGHKKLSRSNSASSTGSFGKARRSSLAKLESLQETSDEATQKYITSQVGETACTHSASRGAHLLRAALFLCTALFLARLFFLAAR